MRNFEKLKGLIIKKKPAGETAKLRSKSWVSRSAV